MTREQIKDFLRTVGGPNIQLVDHTGWVNFNCLFGPFLHASGADKRPSAGISINDDCSIYNCKSCHTKGPLHWIMREYQDCTGEDFTALIEELKDEALFEGVIPAWDAPRAAGRELPEPLSKEVYLDLYDPAYEHWYVNEERGISRDTATRLDLRVDYSDSGGKERILFPVYHHRNGFYGFTGRAVDSDVYPPIRDYHNLPKEFLLLGSHLLQPNDKYLLIVEGLFDLAMMVQYGFPAVAYMGSLPTEHQVDALIDIGLPVYFFCDNPLVDKAGADALERMKESRLLRHVPVMQVRYPRRVVNLKDGSAGIVKDPDELRAEEVERMIKEARLL
jgi:hypothetical protein